MPRYLCPVCRAPRREDLRDDLTFETHFKMAFTILALAAFCYLLKGWGLAFRSLFFYLPLWAGMEFVHWVRVRQATKCAACGFDPILYRKDWRAARRKVEARLGELSTQLRARAEEQTKLEMKARSTPVSAPVRLPEVPPSV
jgi:hypothetical protein